MLDAFRKRLTFPQLKKDAINLYKRFSPDKLLIEDKSSGTALIQELQAEYIFGIVPCSPPPGSDKLMRLHAQSTKFEAGQVYLPHQATWLDEYVGEITGFPGGKHDDQVDSTSQALRHLGEVTNSFGLRDAISRRYSVARIYETW